MAPIDPQARILTLERELAGAHLKIQSLIEKLRQQRVKLLGPRSETLSALQLELRVEEFIPCAEQTCRECGATTAVIGYDESEQLDLQPARYFVRVVKREERAWRCCQAGTVTMPALARRIVEKGLASDRVVVETVVAKYSDHLPLYRQAAIPEREAGLKIGRATLDGWVMRVGESLGAVVSAMRRDLLRGWYLQADETIVPV